MSCWHGRHGCGPWYGPPCGPGRYDPGDRYVDWYEEAPPRIRRRRPRSIEEGTEELEARLAELRDQVHRIESELSDLRREERPAEGL